MVGEWKKRKSKCLLVLEQLDENSDGTISKVKCLKGDGQIAIESDEGFCKEKVAARNGGGKKKGLQR